MAGEHVIAVPCSSAGSVVDFPDCSGAQAALWDLCRRLLANPWFSRTVLSAIFLNTVVLAVEADSPNPTFGLRAFLVVAEWFFFVLFNCELVIKVTALGPRKYAASGWNRFDGFLVFATWVDLLLQNVAKVDSGGLNLTQLRVLRLVRLFRLLRGFKGAFAEVLAHAFPNPNRRLCPTIRLSSPRSPVEGSSVLC